MEAVVRGVRERNEPPIPPGRVLGLASASAIDAWLLQHPETVSWREQLDVRVCVCVCVCARGR